MSVQGFHLGGGKLTIEVRGEFHSVVVGHVSSQFSASEFRAVPSGHATGATSPCPSESRARLKFPGKTSLLPHIAAISRETAGEARRSRPVAYAPVRVR